MKTTQTTTDETETEIATDGGRNEPADPAKALLEDAGGL